MAPPGPEKACASQISLPISHEFGTWRRFFLAQQTYTRPFAFYIKTNLLPWKACQPTSSYILCFCVLHLQRLLKSRRPYYVQRRPLLYVTLFSFVSCGSYIMSDAPGQPSSRQSRSPVNVRLETSELTYSNLSLEPRGEHLQDTYQSKCRKPGGSHYQDPEFNPQRQSPATYLHSGYPERNPTPNPNPTGAPVGGSQQHDPHLYQSSTLFFPSEESTQSSMMSNRDMGYALLPRAPEQMLIPGYSYGYMPGPVPNLSSSHPYGSTLAPMPSTFCPEAVRSSCDRETVLTDQFATVYYHDAHAQRTLSGLSRPTFLPNLGPRGLHSEEREPVSRKRRRDSPETRRQNKLRVRTTRLPSIVGVGAEELHVPSDPVDMFATAPSVPTTYVPDSIDRSFSRPSIAPLRGDYRQPG